VSSEIKRNTWFASNQNGATVPTVQTVENVSTDGQVLRGWLAQHRPQRVVCAMLEV
jgi:dTDP-4-dehydrorhamnose 3,5-epimerase-like enzyme